MNYDKLIYESRPVKFNDYMSNKYDIVHNELYKDALCSYLNYSIYSLLVEKVLYKLISKFNNFITQYNDVDQFLNFDNIHLEDEFKITEYENITEDMIKFPNIIYNDTNKPFINALIDSIWTDNNCTPICDAFKELDMTEDEQNEYITFIIFNILVLLHTCKLNISNIVHATNISDFIIRYNNSIYVIDEEGQNFISEEDSNSNDEFDEAIFIYEDMIMDNYHIGYTKSGKWLLDIDPSIDISSVFDDLQLAMNKTNDTLVYIVTSNMVDRFLQKHKIIENKNSEYWKPSSIIIYSTTYPYSKKSIDLTPWWNLNQKYDNLNLTDIKIIDEQIKDSQIEDIDYVRGKVKIYSKLNDIHYSADFNYVKEDTAVNDDIMSKTFVNKIKNL